MRRAESNLEAGLQSRAEQVGGATEPMVAIEVTEALARDLLVDQHPDLADLPVRRAGRGWDNAMFRFGDVLALRLPRRIEGATLIEHERVWLPTLLDGVPGFEAGGLDASAHRRAGHPARGYPWNWAVVTWYDGDVVADTPVADPMDAGRRLGRFCAGLHRPASEGAPDNPWRGGPVADRAGVLAEHLEGVVARGRSLGDGVDRHRVQTVFDGLAAIGASREPALWIHGDLHPGNLIARGGHLRAVIDFGDLTAGDRATDLSVAWSLFPDNRSARSAFREASGADRPIDDATWTRARAWAIALNVSYLRGEYVTPERLALARRGLAAALTGP